MSRIPKGIRRNLTETMNKIKKLLATSLALLACSVTVVAQDKIVHPDISYAGTPRELILGGMSVSGIEGYEDYMLTSISGLQVGQKVSVPGNEITDAVKRYWRHGLFSFMQISADSDRNFIRTSLISSSL